MSTEFVWVLTKKKKKACCECGTVTTTKRCPACKKVHARKYNTAYVKRMRAKIYATRPPKKCTDCGVDLTERHRIAALCCECSKKRQAARAAAWQKTPGAREAKRRYQSTPEALERYRADSRSPETIAYRKEYYQRPEVKARRKARMQTPEGKEANRRAVRKWHAKKKANLAALSEAEKETK